MKNKIVVVFDLDDTLYNEIDYLKSAYKEIASAIVEDFLQEVNPNILYNEMITLYYSKKNTFTTILEKYNLEKVNINYFLEIYRNHKPKITLTYKTKFTLKFLRENNIDINLITDGRSIQQHSKIKALKLNKYLNHIVISEEIGTEKPCLNNFTTIQNQYTHKNIIFFYIGDNLKKDFIAPNQLGWQSICLLDNGLNIHSQDINIQSHQIPKHKISNIISLIKIIKKFKTSNER